MLGEFAENTPVFLSARLSPLPGDRSCTVCKTQLKKKFGWYVGAGCRVKRAATQLADVRRLYKRIGMVTIESDSFDEGREWDYGIY